MSIVDAEGDLSTTTLQPVKSIDVSQLPPNEAIAQLIEQNRTLALNNQALNAHIAKLKQVHEDNSTLRDEVRPRIFLRMLPYHHHNCCQM